MTQLYYCPALAYGGTTFYLPPWIRATIRKSQYTDRRSIPHTDSMVNSEIRNNQGTKINLSVRHYPDTPNPETILQWFEDLWTHFSGHEFKFFIFNDRAFTGCTLDDSSEEISSDLLASIENYSVSFTSTDSTWDTSQQLTFTDYSTEYDFADVVGIPSGASAVVPGGGLTVVTQASRQTPTFTFPGIIDTATTAGQEFRYVVGGSTGSVWRLKSLQITGVEIPGDSTTTVRASTAGVGGGGSTLDATVAAGARFGSIASGAIDITAGSTLYIFIPTGGGGGAQNVTVQPQLEAQ